MSDSSKIIRKIEIYTETVRWSGEMAIPPALRLSDFLNDPAQLFFALRSATMFTWHNHSPQGATNFDEVNLSRDSILVALIRPGVTPTSARTGARVAKNPHRIMIYIPPFAIAGDFHRPAEIPLLNALNVTGVNFLPLTDASLQWMDTSLLCAEIEFAAVNRHKITALHSLYQRERQETNSLWEPSKKQLVGGSK